VASGVLSRGPIPVPPGGAILDREKAAQYGLVAKERPRREVREASAKHDGAGKQSSEAEKQSAD